jgi:hypothetical protein
MRRLISALDGLMVAGLGVFMLALIYSGTYALFMNPRFQILTGATGAALCLAGLVFALAPAGRPDPLRTIAFGLLSVLLLASVSAPSKYPPVVALSPPAATVEAVSPTLTHAGTTYLKMNPARLVFQLTASGIPAGDIVSRGIVKRGPQLDREGLFALFRVNMVCCLADAVAIGVLVKPESGDLPPEGGWVTVYGAVERLAEPAGVAEVGGVEAAPYAVLYDGALLRATMVRPIAPPAFPYVFELPPSGGKPPRLSGEEDDY